MLVRNIPVGSGVTVYDKKDNTTLLLLVHNAIDYKAQDTSLLSTNQMRYNNVDVCDTHQKYTVGGRKGLFRIKVKDHELPFRMHNGLAMLPLCFSTEENLNDSNIQVVTLTSTAPWKPANISGYNFTPNADMEYYKRLGIFRPINFQVTPLKINLKLLQIST